MVLNLMVEKVLIIEKMALGFYMDVDVLMGDLRRI